MSEPTKSYKVHLLTTALLGSLGLNGVQASLFPEARAAISEERREEVEISTPRAELASMTNQQMGAAICRAGEIKAGLAAGRCKARNVESSCTQWLDGQTGAVFDPVVTRAVMRRKVQVVDDEAP